MYVAKVRRIMLSAGVEALYENQSEVKKETAMSVSKSLIAGEIKIPRLTQYRICVSCRFMEQLKSS
jgi:hypothetical protein